jgi:hypothetical protein
VSELLFPVAADGSMPVSDDEASMAPQHIMKSRSRQAIAKENLFYVHIYPHLGTDDSRMFVFPVLFFGSIDSAGANIRPLSASYKPERTGLDFFEACF